MTSNSGLFEKIHFVLPINGSDDNLFSRGGSGFENAESGESMVSGIGGPYVALGALLIDLASATAPKFGGALQGESSRHLRSIAQYL